MRKIHANVPYGERVMQNIASGVKSICLMIAMSVAMNSYADDLVFHRSEATKKLNLAISDTTQVGGLLFLSGQLGNIPGTPTLVKGGIGPETKQSLNNIKSILERLDVGVSKIAKCTVYLVDAEDRPIFSDVYSAFFENHYPSRTTVIVKELALNARIEIECIAEFSN